MIRVLVVVLLLCGSAAAQSLTLSPAVVPLGGRPGQSTSQKVTLSNGTAHVLSFKLVAKDVVVRDGVRVFVDAGELRNSVAATAVFSTPTVLVRPGEERSVEVTLTLPTGMTHRAVVILFEGTTQVARGTTVSIGSLLTFDLAGRASLAPSELLTSPPTASANAAFTLPVANDGSEPVIVRGAAAILGPTGALAGKLVFDSRRLLPGEHAALVAEYPGDLPAGTYRIVATLEGAKRAWTRSAELVVP